MLCAVRARVALLVMAGLVFLSGCSRDESSGDGRIIREISLGKVTRNDAQGLVSVESIQVFVGSIGPIVAGEVRNSSREPVQNAKVTARLKDEKGKTLREETGFTLLDVIPPGTSAPFFVPFTYRSARAKTADASVEAQPGGKPGTGFLEVTAEEGKLSEPIYEVSGTVRNRHSRAVRVAKVVATFYDAGGKVLGAAVAFIDAEVLKPGEAASFRLVQQERADKVARYTLLTEAIPE